MSGYRPTYKADSTLPLRQSLIDVAYRANQSGDTFATNYPTPPEVPVGGYKQSGVGRENGLQAIEHYTQMKTVYANMGDVEKTY